jgi:precorrin-2/cobalt-factor-2 C20-methyltransferase
MPVGKLYGVGLGPGDPKLITIKAKEILEEVDVVCAPISKVGRRSIALEMVKPYVKGKEILTLLFPMHTDPDILRPYWEKAGAEICNRLKEGKDVAFITIGDPSFYSTFINVMEIIRERQRDAEIITIPGVASILACFAGLNEPLVDKDEKLAVFPAEYGLEELEEISKFFDTIVLMKVSRSFDKIYKKLDKLGLLDKAVLVSKCGTRDFFSSPLREVKGKVDFLSMIILKGLRG